jgi:hypothetical protein
MAKIDYWIVIQVKLWALRPERNGIEKLNIGKLGPSTKTVLDIISSSQFGLKFENYINDLLTTITSTFTFAAQNLMLKFDCWETLQWAVQESILQSFFLRKMDIFHFFVKKLCNIIVFALFSDVTNWGSLTAKIGKQS